MKKALDVVAGYILAVFTAAFVITLSVTPIASWGPTGNVPWQQAATDLAVFWISAGSRIAIAAAIPALLGVVVAHLSGLKTTFFYCLWALVIALGLSLATTKALSIESLITLAIAGIAAGLSYRWMNPPPRKG